MKRIFLMIVLGVFVFSPAATAYYRGGYRGGNLGLYREDYLAVNMKGRYGINAQFATYRPADSAINNRDTLLGGTLRYWNTPFSSLNLSYGTWKHSWSGANGGTATINPLTLGVNFYNNAENNIKFFYGAGIGSYRYDWSRLTKVANGDYNKTAFGFMVNGGLEYYMTESFTANIELKYHGCRFTDIVPETVGGVAQTDRNIDISDFTIGAGLTIYF